MKIRCTNYSFAYTNMIWQGSSAMKIEIQHEIFTIYDNIRNSRDLVNIFVILLLKNSWYQVALQINFCYVYGYKHLYHEINSCSRWSYLFLLLIDEDTDKESFSFVFTQLRWVAELQLSSQTLVAFKQLAVCQHLIVDSFAIFSHVLSLHVQHRALQLQGQLRRWAWRGGRWGHARRLV